jgi:multiple sugar transport system permease protein
MGGCEQGTPSTELKVANWAGPEELEIERRNVASFQRTHPEVRIRIEPIPSNYKEKILTSMAAGTPPDVFLLDAIMVPVFIGRDVLLDLMPFVRKYGVHLDGYYSNVLSIAMRGGKVYALPKDFTPMVMYYNKDLFDAAGVDYPEEGWTWSDFLRIARVLTRDIDGDGRVDQYGTATYSKFFYWPPWVWSNGGDFLDPTGKSASGYLNSPATENALQFLIDLRKVHRVAPTSQTAASLGGTGSMFYTGRIGMMESGHWWLPTLRRYIAQGKIRVGVAPMPVPQGGKPITVLYESGWCVSKATKRPDLAAQLAIFLASPEANRRRMAQGLAIPSNIALEQEVLTGDDSGLEKVFYAQVQHARPPWGATVERFSRIEDLTEDAFEEILIGGRDMHETLTEAAEKIDRELSAPPPKAVSGETQILGFIVLSIASGIIAFFILALSTPSKRRRETVRAYAFLTPSFLHIILFSLGPVLFALYLSFHRWNIIDPVKPFVGLDNFRMLLKDRLFWNALKNTAFFTLQVPVGMAISLMVALMMNTRIRGVVFLRTLFFLPSVSSFVAIAMVWQWIYNPEYGLLNYLLGLLGLGRPGWLADPSWALIAVMIMTVWIGIGYQMVIFLAGLQGIPDVLYEAAVIDGAGPWKRFWHVTLPLLKPTTFFILVTSIIASFQVFTSIYIMTQGGPMRATDVVVYHIYQNAWEYLKMGYASAMSWTLFVLIMIVTWVQFKVLGKNLAYT